ncbi:MAG TPA: hypothetical protein VF482_02450 [Trebonia sp.]
MKTRTRILAGTGALGLIAVGGTVATINTVAASSAMTPSPSPSTSGAQAQNTTCRLIVPANPLTAQGLATPYQLEGPPGMPSPQQSGCTMANAANLGAFVQATILDPATGELRTYEPLVITSGTQPAIPPVVPSIPQDAVVTVNIGFNGNVLALVGATPDTLAGAHAVTGLPGSPFGQVSFLNGVRFFHAAFQAERQGKLTVPPTGTTTIGVTGKPCPTTRSYTLVDQDPSDNVTTAYLVTGDGRTAQDNAANRAALPGATVVTNGSDNALLSGFVDPALGCKPFTAPDLTNDGQPGTSQALNELSAASNQQAPLALVPVNDTMTLVNGAYSIQKTNLYRGSVGQPLLPLGETPTESNAIGNENAATFCQDILNIQTPFLALNKGALQNFTSPVPATGNNLFTFMAARLSASFTNLGCVTFGLHNTVQLTLNGNGVATAATFNTAPQVADASLGTGRNVNAPSLPSSGQNPGQHGQVPSPGQS